MKKYTLNEICFNITDGTHSAVIDDKQGDCFLLSCKNIKDGKIIINQNDRRINIETLKLLRKRTKMELNDVILTSVGTIGQSSYIRENNPCFEFQRSVAILKPNPNYILSRYLHYYFTSLNGQSNIQSRIKGAAQPCLFLNDIKTMKIELPELEIQQHIVDTIGSVDNLIEKCEENYSKICFYQQGIWDKFIKNSTSEMTKLEDCILKANTGADAIQKAPIVNYQTVCRCVRVGDFTNNRNYNHWGYCKIKDVDYKRYKLKKDDILITRTASIGLVKFIFEDLNAVYNNGIIRITANENKIKPIILYLICISNNFINYIKENESGSSTRSNMKIDYVMKYKFNLPTIEKQNKIESDLLEIETYKSYLLKEISKLKELKNLLLQKYFG